jgi:hypothetical protein
MLRDAPRSGARLLALAAALLLAGCGGEDSPVRPPPADEGAVQGMVVDQNGNEQRGVAVALRASGGPQNLGSAITNALGEYSFISVAAGEYDVVLEVPPAAQVTGSNPLPVTVEDGATASGDFELELLPVGFAQHVQPVFTASCALGGCHAGASPPEGLNLEEGQAYGLTVDIPSVQMASLDRIEPGDPGASYLIRKIEGTNIVANRMPLGGDPLPLPVIDMIRRWVSEGSLDN